MSNFKIEITSVADREFLVAEIWYGETFVAEVSRETGGLEIEFYLDKAIVFELSEFLEILEIAKREILKL